MSLTLILLSLLFSLYPSKDTIRVGNSVTLTSAIQNAEGNPIIFLEDGEYVMNETQINHSLRLTSAGGAVLKPLNKSSIFVINADSVTIDNLIFKDVPNSFTFEYAALYLDEVSNVLIENNRFENNFYAIYGAKSSEIKVKNNQIHASNKRESASGNAIHFWYSKDLFIVDNTISGHRDGIYFEFVSNAMVENNLSQYNLRYGLHFMFSDNCNYTKNHFNSNGAGVAIMYSKFVNITHNRFTRNIGANTYGLLLKEMFDSNVTDNIFEKNTSALYVEASNRLEVIHNDFLQNGWAVKIKANSVDVNFKLNNFIANSFDVATNSNSNFNQFDTNYWSKHKVYDIDNNGIADEPYRPVSYFSVIIENHPIAMILLESQLVELLNILERSLPVLTPVSLYDASPLLNPVQHDNYSTTF